ncbi:MAG: serine/threonine protein kinase, partial [Acidimicrobiia bacterium]|nr:serine/threonine protein kinase [Acidimicrobiia bacterium]
MQATPEPDVLAGRYEVGPVIGHGGMGEVRRGRDQRLGRDVAIKFLRADLAAQPEVRARFEHEARAAAALSHPAVVTVFDSGETGDVPYLVMECLPGDTLADRLADGPLDPGRVRTMADDLLGALEAAHALGVIHRDVKPGNVLFTADGRAKLADFGIAKSTDSLDQTVTGLVIGTPAYLAPERLAGAAASPASDLYSLGVVLYEALTGERPFRGETPIEIAHAVATSTPTPAAERRPAADPHLTAAVDRAMARDVEHRFRTAGAMRVVLTGGDRSGTSNETAVFPAVDATVALPAQVEPPAP